MTWFAWAFIAGWALTVPLRLAIAARIVRFRLPYPFFAAWLIIGSVQTAHRIHTGLTGGQRAYEKAWSNWQWLTVALLVAVVAECFILHARHFREFAGFGAKLATAVAIGSLLTAWLSGGAAHGAPDNPLVLLRQYSAVFGYTAVTLTFLIFSVFGKTYFRANLRLHRSLLQWYFFATALGYFIQGAVRRGQWYDVASALLTTGGAAVCYVAWLRLNGKGETWTPPAPSGMSIEEIEERKERLSAWAAGAGRAG